MNGVSLENYQLVSVKQFAEIVGQKRCTISSWAENIADFPQTIFIGRKRFFKLTDVLDWLETRFNGKGKSE